MPAKFQASRFHAFGVMEDTRTRTCTHIDIYYYGLQIAAVLLPFLLPCDQSISYAKLLYPTHALLRVGLLAREDSVFEQSPTVVRPTSFDTFAGKSIPASLCINTTGTLICLCKHLYLVYSDVCAFLIHPCNLQAAHKFDGYED